MLAPVVAEIAEETAGKVKVCKANVDEESELAFIFNVSSIPTLVVVKDGKIVNVSVGVQTKEQILAMLSATNS
jgi:thioredoxin 1